jgi:hypothetical protein
MTVPAMADVDIIMTNDANVVTIGYETDGEEVRAFALEISVSPTGTYVVGSEEPNAADYYVFPTNITFTVVDGNTVIDELGNPVAESDANGGVLETASLYAANDPCGHTDPPPTSGTLVSFAVDCSQGDPNITVSLALNGQRGNVVLKDPDVTPTVNLPVPLVVSCENACWACTNQPLGDATGDGKVNIFDYLAFKKAVGTKADTHPHGTAQGEYNCCADFTQDGQVNIFDYLTLKKGILTPPPIVTCADISCM